jgi:hypothetical protein
MTESSDRTVIAPLTLYDAAYVAARMRAADRDEIAAMRFDFDHEMVARECMLAPGFSWAIGRDRPIAAIGAVPMCPGVWTAFMFATDRWMEIALAATRHVRRTMIPALMNVGAHRVECRSIEDHLVAHRWLEALGAVREGIERGRARDGRDFWVYVWSRQSCA